MNDEKEFENTTSSIDDSSSLDSVPVSDDSSTFSLNDSSLISSSSYDYSESAITSVDSSAEPEQGFDYIKGIYDNTFYITVFIFILMLAFIFSLFGRWIYNLIS